MPEYTYPGVYVEETSGLPPAITPLLMSVPVFIGYTEKCNQLETGDLLFTAKEINSLLEFEQFFGIAKPETNSICIEFTGSVATAFINEDIRCEYLMYYSLQLFFANGGGKCFIVSVGNYEITNSINVNELLDGLEIARTINSAGLILFPDAINLASETDYYLLFKEAMKQAAILKDRFVLLDVYENKENGNNWMQNIQSRNGLSGLRNTLSGNPSILKYAAAYFPQVYTNIRYEFLDNKLDENNAEHIMILNADATNFFDLQTRNIAQYTEAKRAIDQLSMLLPVTPAVAGVYTNVEIERGLWKAPANVNIDRVLHLKYLLVDEEQESLNIDPIAGKSINVIRQFTGRGNALIWGARTLAGNDNEWKYISTQRYVAMLEKSINKGITILLTKPNTLNTWVRIKALIQNYLASQWRQGALLGPKPEKAFFVKLGLNETMTAQDVLENRIIIECGVALLRPAEFIIMRIDQNMSI